MLEIVNIIEETELNNYHHTANTISRTQELEKLGAEFEKCNQINNAQVRLRMKNYTSRKMSEVFLEEPLLINSFNLQGSESYTCGIADKIKFLPQADDLAIIEQISANAQRISLKVKL